MSGEYRRNRLRCLLYLLGGSLIVSVISTTIRELVYFQPLTGVAYGEVVFLRQLAETAFIFSASLPIVLVLFMLASRPVRRTWGLSFLRAFLVNLCAFPVAFLILATAWWDHGAATVWTVLLILGGTAFHGVALMLAPPLTKIEPRQPA